MFLKVNGHEGLVRDAKSGAILNTSKEEYKNYMIARERALQQKVLIEQQQKEIQSLKSEFSEMKSLLKQLLEK
jgi:endonuclease/exonuclease/phosphatase (EEP) superfamily protein YafD